MSGARGTQEREARVRGTQDVKYASGYTFSVLGTLDLSLSKENTKNKLGKLTDICEESYYQRSS